MTHKDYRDTGIRVFQSQDGGLLFVNDEESMSMQIPGGEVEGSLWTERGAFLVIRQIIHFVRKSSDLCRDRNQTTGQSDGEGVER